MGFSRRCCAIGAAYYNMFACIPAVVYLLILLIVYVRLDDLRPNYADSFTVHTVKEVNTATLFIWFVLEAAGVLCCIRCVKGITRERVELVSQYIVWKAILVVFFGVDCLISCIGTEVDYRLILFPALNFIQDAILLVIMFLFYQTLPDDSSSEEEPI